MRSPTNDAPTRRSMHQSRRPAQRAAHDHDVAEHPLASSRVRLVLCGLPTLSLNLKRARTSWGEQRTPLTPARKPKHLPAHLRDPLSDPRRRRPDAAADPRPQPALARRHPPQRDPGRRRPAGGASPLLTGRSPRRSASTRAARASAAQARANAREVAASLSTGEASTWIRLTSPASRST